MRHLLRYAGVDSAQLFQQNLHWPWFDRLRAEDPVHWCEPPQYRPFWAVTKAAHITEVSPLEPREHLLP